MRYKRWLAWIKHRKLHAAGDKRNYCHPLGAWNGFFCASYGITPIFKIDIPPPHLKKPSCINFESSLASSQFASEIMCTNQLELLHSLNHYCICRSVGILAIVCSKARRVAIWSRTLLIACLLSQEFKLKYRQARKQIHVRFLQSLVCICALLLILVFSLLPADTTFSELTHTK